MRALLFAALIAAYPATAQTADQQVDAIRASAGFKAAEAALDKGHDGFVEEIVELTQIPSPPFKEAVRAKAMAAKFVEVGLHDVTIDEVGNVIGLRPGSDPHVKLLVVAAHLDTVFPEGTDVTVKRSGTRLSAPGIGDDTRNLAALLAYARALDAGKVKTKASILFVANVGEEGRGDLRGVKYLFGKGPYKDRIGSFISLDGSGAGRIVNGGIGSKRYHVVFKGPGGHSWGAFGIVNPMAAMSAAVSELYKIKPPTKPRTTYAASVTGGGTSINAIPDEVYMDFDMRSESVEALTGLEKQFLTIVNAAVDAENAARSTRNGKVTADPQLVGDRPAGVTAPTTPLVTAMVASAKSYGYPTSLENSSTDANMPMTLGIPAVTIGAGGIGGRAHAPDEWIDVARPASLTGLQAGLLSVIAAAGIAK